MEKNEIKKEFYRELTPAYLIKIQSGVAHYTSVLANKDNVYFDIPVSDMGTASFLKIMDAVLLIRWLV